MQRNSEKSNKKIERKESDTLVPQHIVEKFMSVSDVCRIVCEIEMKKMSKIKIEKKNVHKYSLVNVSHINLY